MSNWVCIDFGTSNTAAAIEIDGSPHAVSFGTTHLLPTLACVLPNGTIEVGHNAEQFRRESPESFKQEFKLQIADDIDINHKNYTDIVTELFSVIKGYAEIENNHEQISKVILTIPASYTESDRRKNVMRKAALSAGFELVEFLSEPQAAAYHYANIVGKKNTGISLIYDLGGGTFDAALLDLTRPDAPKLLGCDSGSDCGGQFFDKKIYNYLKESVNEDKPLSRSERLVDYVACRRLKETLSVKESASQRFSNGEILSLTRNKLNELISPLVEKTFESCDELIRLSNKQWSDVSQVLFVGGSTAIPLIIDSLKKHLISHNATTVKLINNARGANGNYDHILATCLGGISKKILPPPPPPEKVAVLLCNGRPLQLKHGENKFGRGEGMDFRFQDSSMSHHHFTINVSKDGDGKLSYSLTTYSKSKSTIINNMEALDLRFAPISRISTFLLDGYTILAGKTTFTFKKQ